MDIKVVMTRDEDVFLRLSERTKIANENNGSLFISIHTNAAEDRRACGFEPVWIGLIKKRVQSRDRGVKQAGFVVLARASMPNVLVELGFISNPAEEKKLRSPQYRDQLATAIYRAVQQYEKTL